jgi:hypothetical protein
MGIRRWESAKFHGGIYILHTCHGDPHGNISIVDIHATQNPMSLELSAQTYIIVRTENSE